MALSPSAIDSSSLTIPASKSEHEDSIFGDYTLDLSFLSSDDSLSRDVDTAKVLLNTNPLTSTIAGDGTVLSENSSEEDTPCWIGINSLASGSISRRSTDDLCGFRRLNPLAPQFIPSNSNIKDVKSSSSLNKSLSSEFTHLVEVGRDNADESLGFVSQDRNEFQLSKRLDPLAPVFVPSSAKLSHEKHLAFEKTARSSSVEADIHIPSSYNHWLESTKLGSSSNKSHGQMRLNPLAPQFSLADTKPKAYRFEKYQAADDVAEVDFEHVSSALISPTADSNFGSTKWYAVEPNTTLAVNGSQNFQHPLPFHVVETAASSSSSNLKASSPKMDVMKLLTTIHGLSELLTLAHGSESADSPNAEELDLINSTVHNLNMYIQTGIQEQTVNQSVVQPNSYDLQLLPNKSKLSIRDLQLPMENNMTLDLDVRRKEKYSVVSGETFPHSGLCQYGVTKDNGFGHVVAKSGYQQNHQDKEQNNQHALFYKSLWLKAEAERCLMVYETSLSNPGS